MSKLIQKGDKCWVNIPWLKKHYGVCIGHQTSGEPMFVHNTARRGRVTRATLAEFSGGRRVFVELRAQPGFEHDVARRALDLVGQPYDLLTFNCEHLANLATTGSATSAQVAKAGAGAAVLLIFAHVMLFNKNGTSLDSNGYRRDASGRFASRRWW